MRRGGEERQVPVEDLRIGDLVIVKPGEAITADGEVLGGESLVEEAAITGRLLGLIAIADPLRATAREAIQELKSQGVRTVMLTGDNPRVAEAMVKSLGMDECHAGLFPDEKLAIVRELQQKYGAVAMVGDGVNDAPALASAAVGVAMGAAGTDVALETADVVLMSSDLNKLVEAMRLSRRTVRVLKQNWYFALSIVLLLITIALLGKVPLPLAVVGHEGNTLIVVLSGLRLLVYDPAKA